MEATDKNAKPKIKLAVYWGAACGGCCVSVLDVHESLFDVVAAADLVFWPIALDTKYKDVEAMASLRAASLRRSVVAPVRVRVAALRLLCETADRLGVTLTLAQYRQHLEKAEQELARLAHQSPGVHQT